MLERPLLPAGQEQGAGDGALRVPGWPELAARLGAARDLRHSLAAGHSANGGGFGCFCATHGEQVNNTVHDVNLTGLAHGKDDAGTISASDMGHSAQADREMQ